MSWNALPTELHLAIVHLLPADDVRALAATAAPVRALCLPAIFANVDLVSTAALYAFVRHVPTSYGAFIRSLAITSTGAHTDLILALLDTCTRLQILSLSLAPSLDTRAIAAFARLQHVHTFHMECCGREDVSPISERLAVALAASLPSLTHLSLARITRSAAHVDLCDVPLQIPIVTNDMDVPPHPLLGCDLSLPSLLRLPSLRTLEIRDTWMDHDTRIDPAACRLDKLVLTGSMYADYMSEARACATWLQACSPLHSLELGTPLAPPLSSTVPHVSHVHLNASRMTADDLPSTLVALASSGVESISIGYEERDDALKSSKDDFARECALDDLSDWREAVDTFLAHRSREEWSVLSRVHVSLGQDIEASWDI